jgi:hypothetical protein
MSRRLAALAVLAAALAAPAAAVSQTAPAGSAASAPAGSAASAPAPAEEERPLDPASIPAEKSPAPRPGEWTTAIRVLPTRRGPAAAGCRAYLLREWLRVRCPGAPFALSMLGGELDGIAFWIDARTSEGEVLLPLRRGGRHVFQFWKGGKDEAGAFVAQPLLVLQQYWVDGGAAPVVTLF